jgi:hypothetical protein
MESGHYRHDNGRFVSGNPGGPGRPRGCKPAETLRRALFDSVTAEQVQAVIRKLRELALDGNVTAARCFLDHAVGRPVQALELSAPASPGISPMTVVRLVIDALSDLPNYDEIRARLVAAFERLEPTRDGPARLEPSDCPHIPGA